MFLTWNSTRSDPKSSVPSSTTGVLPLVGRPRWPASSVTKCRERVGADHPGWLWMGSPGLHPLLYESPLAV